MPNTPTPKNLDPKIEDKEPSPLAASDLAGRPKVEDKEPSPLAASDLTDRSAVEDKDQTWVSAKDADGETQRIRSEDYTEWEREQEVKRAQRR